MYRGRCPHEKLVLTEIDLYDHPEFFDDERFPSLVPNVCDETCREKMKVYFKILLELHYKWTMQYIEDARLSDPKSEKDGKSYYPNLSNYFLFFERLNHPDIELSVLKYSKVGLLGGKPVRLCDLPEGTKCDFDASNLEEYEKQMNK